MGTQLPDVMDYDQYDASDFAADSGFQDWVLGRDAQAVTFWEQWLATHPDRRGVLIEARELVYLLHDHVQQTAYPTERAQALDRLHQTLGPSAFGGRTLRLAGGWGRWAAAAILVMGLSTTYFVYWSGISPTTSTTHRKIRPSADGRVAQVVRRAAYGQTATLTLPDGSHVTLNGHSTLTYAPTWPRGGDRAVWLEGEAFFDVAHQEPTPGRPVKFTVHTAGVRIEVLGTRFNVRHRRNRVQVVLTEGRIRLRVPGDSTRQAVVMRPGQLVELADSAQRRLQFKPMLSQLVRPELFSSWKSRQFLFDHTPLSQVAEQIEDIYGWRVEFSEEGLKHETLTGVIPTHDERVLFEALSAALDLDVRRTDNHVLFRRRH